jgi:hypothetical protein
MDLIQVKEREDFYSAFGLPTSAWFRHATPIVTTNVDAKGVIHTSPGNAPGYSPPNPIEP